MVVRRIGRLVFYDDVVVLYLVVFDGGIILLMVGMVVVMLVVLFSCFCCPLAEMIFSCCMSSISVLMVAVGKIFGTFFFSSLAE